MSIFKNKFINLKRCSSVSLGKRFLCFLFDFAIITVASALVFGGISGAVENTDSYKKAYKGVQDEVAYYNNYINNSHVVTFTDETLSERYSTDDIAFMHICRQIVKSYEVFGSGHSDFEDFYNEHKNEVEKYGNLTKDDDNLSYFYLNYLNSGVNDNNEILNTHGKTYKQYFFDAYKAEMQASSGYLVFDEAYDCPLVRVDYAYSMMIFYWGDESYGTLYNDGKTYGNSISAAYVNLLNNAEDMMVFGEPYYSEHYLAYEEYTLEVTRKMNITLMLSILLVAFIYLGSSKILFGDNCTYSHRIFGLGYVTSNGNQVSIFKQILLTIISSIKYVAISLFLYIIPPFNFNLGLLSYPFANGIMMSAGLIILILSLFTIVDGCVALFTHYHQSLINLIFNVKLVDIKHSDELDVDDQYEGSAN